MTDKDRQLADYFCEKKCPEAGNATGKPCDGLVKCEAHAAYQSGYHIRTMKDADRIWYHIYGMDKSIFKFMNEQAALNMLVYYQARHEGGIVA